MRTNCETPGEEGHAWLNKLIFGLRYCDPRVSAQIRGKSLVVPRGFGECALRGTRLLKLPLLDGLPDRIRCKIAANHLVLGNTTQRFGHAAFGDQVSFIDRFAQHHLRGDGGARNGYGAAHALESHVHDYIVLDSESNQDGVAVHGTLDDGLRGWVRYPAGIPGARVMVAN